MDFGNIKSKNSKKFKACVTKCSKCSRRIHKPLRVPQFSANLVYLPFMVISYFHYNKLIKQNNKKINKNEGKIRSIASMA